MLGTGVKLCKYAFGLLICLLLAVQPRTAEPINKTESPRQSALQPWQAPIPARNLSHVLGIAMLITDPWEKGVDRVSSARAAIQLLALHLLPYTAARIYVFTRRSLVARLTDDLLEPGPAPIGPHLHNLTQGQDLLQVLPIQDEHWQVPDVPAAEESIWEGRWNMDYRLMGNWRLQHMPHIMRSLGHDYVLQADDDSFVLEPITQDLVELFRSKRYVMGARKFINDGPIPLWGLAELARFFIMQEKIKPVLLFHHCHPPDITGLYTPNNLPDVAIDEEHRARMRDMGLPGRGGYDGTVLVGNFVIIDLVFWFRPEVQRFVHLARSSGGSMRYRWNEQGVQSMVWLIFVPAHRFCYFDFAYQHRVHKGLSLNGTLLLAANETEAV